MREGCVNRGKEKKTSRREVRGANKSFAQAPARTMSVEAGGETWDRAKWKEEIESKASRKYINPEEPPERRRERVAGYRRLQEASALPMPRITMGILLEARARLNMNKASGDDGVAAEMIMELLMICMYFILHIFNARFEGCEKYSCEVTSWITLIMNFLT